MASISISRRQVLSTPYEFDDSAYIAAWANLLADAVVALLLTAATIGALYLLATYSPASYVNSETHTMPSFVHTNGSISAGETAQFGPVLK